MRKLLIIPALILIAASPPPTSVEIGPEPAFQDAVAMTEQAIRARMIDPDSTRIEWPYGFSGGSLKAIFSKRHVGWFTCGLVNSKNRMGGYSGQSYFEVLIHNGIIEVLDIGEAGDIDIVGMSCQKLIKDGVLRKAPALGGASAMATPMAAAGTSAASAAAKGGIGISFLPSPLGAILLAVAPGSRAESAGLKAGETIEAINGIPIKGMDSVAIVAMIHSDPAVLTFTVVGVGDIKLTR